MTDDKTGCRCCDPTADSDPVVRLEMEVAELRAELTVQMRLKQSLDEIYTAANLSEKLLQAHQELSAIRDTICEKFPPISDGPLPHRVWQLCNLLTHEQMERDDARETLRTVRLAWDSDIKIAVEARKELAAIRDTIHELNPMLSDGPLPYRVRQLCDDLTATRKERECLREDNSRLSKACSPGEGVWVWQGDGSDHPESLTCQVLMTANQVRQLTDSNTTLRDLLREAEFDVVSRHLRKRIQSALEGKP